MPRRRRLRKVVAPPGFKGYKPYGTNNTSKDSIELLYEEYEAIKLTDYNLMKHSDASALMGISRPTFARIYESARRKIAKALVETKEIVAVYGNATMLDNNWYICNSCHARYTVPNIIKEKKCALCASDDVDNISNHNKQ